MIDYLFSLHQIRLRIDALESTAEQAVRAKEDGEREENEQLILLQKQLVDEIMK